MLSSGADVAALVWGYKRSRELARRLPAYRGELASTHPVFSFGTKIEEEDGPTVGSTGVPLVKLAHEGEETADTALASNLAATPMVTSATTKSARPSTMDTATRGPVAGPASGPVPVDAPDIEYSKEDEKAIEEWARGFGE